MSKPRDLIAEQIVLSARGIKSTYNAGIKRRDVHKQYNSFVRRLADLDEKHEQGEVLLADLGIITAAPKKPVNKPVKTTKDSKPTKKAATTSKKEPASKSNKSGSAKDNIQKHFESMRSVQQNHQQAKDVLSNIVSTFGTDNKQFKGLIDSAKEHVSKFSTQLDKISKTLSTLAAKHKPAILYDDNEIGGKAIKYIKATVTQMASAVEGKKKPKVTKDEYHLDEAKGGFTFARYLTISNVPKKDKTVQDSYTLVLAVTLLNPKMLKTKKGESLTGSYSNVSIAATTKYVRPSSLPKGFDISEREAINMAHLRDALTYLAVRYNLDAWGSSVKLSPKRLDTLVNSKKLQLMNKTNTKLDSPNIVVYIPVDQWKDLNKREWGKVSQASDLNRDEVFKRLWTEVKYVGKVPLKNQRFKHGGVEYEIYKSDRLAYDLPTRIKKGGKSFIKYVFHILPQKPQETIYKVERTKTERRKADLDKEVNTRRMDDTLRELDDSFKTKDGRSLDDVVTELINVAKRGSRSAYGDD